MKPFELRHRGAPGSASDLFFGTDPLVLRYTAQAGYLGTRPLLVLPPQIVPANGTLLERLPFPQGYPSFTPLYAQILTIDPQHRETLGNVVPILFRN